MKFFMAWEEKIKFTMLLNIKLIAFLLHQPFIIFIDACAHSNLKVTEQHFLA